MQEVELKTKDSFNQESFQNFNSNQELMVITMTFKLNLHIQEMVFKRRNSLTGNDKSFKGGYHIRTSFNVSPNKLIKEISNQRTQITFNFLNKKISNKRIKKVTRNRAPHRCPRRKRINNQRNKIKNFMPTLKIKTRLFKFNISRKQ
ncbi:hypothetical protein M9H77_07499 [Catharanthus roseus]|uniref:Uncharacterized protein n=1 Tax=Catharanthus roseus TaxID=4058 RepID=A0ACC0BV44_CATRO|nr:hypothetical protein M9H77_07499 [Catharanthus roseus]